MAKSDIHMPFYIGDYLADTSRLKWYEHGPYILLIFDYWRNGPPPDDDETLSTICGMPPDKWLEMRVVVSKFFTIHDGNWHHKRIDKERAIAREKVARFSARGSKGSSARWGKPDKEENASSNASSNALGNTSSNEQAMLKQWQSYSKPEDKKQQPSKEVEIREEEIEAAAFKNNGNRKMTDPELNLLARIIEKRVATGRLPGNKPVDNVLALKNTLIRAWEKNPEELRSWRTELKKDDRIRANELRKAKQIEEQQAACNDAAEFSAKEDQRKIEERIKFCEGITAKLAKLGQKTSDAIIQKAVERTKKRYRGFPDSAYRPDSDIVLKEAEKIMFTDGVQKEPAL